MGVSEERHAGPQKAKQNEGDAEALQQDHVTQKVPTAGQKPSQSCRPQPPLFGAQGRNHRSAAASEPANRRPVPCMGVPATRPRTLWSLHTPAQASPCPAQNHVAAALLGIQPDSGPQNAPEMRRTPADHVCLGAQGHTHPGGGGVLEDLLARPGTWTSKTPSSLAAPRPGPPDGSAQGCLGAPWRGGGSRSQQRQARPSEFPAQTIV